VGTVVGRDDRSGRVAIEAGRWRGSLIGRAIGIGVVVDGDEAIRRVRSGAAAVEGGGHGFFRLRAGRRTDFGTRANRRLSGSLKPGSTVPPSNVSPSVRILDTSGSTNTSSVRLFPSTCQTNSTPAWKYSCRFSHISWAVLLGLSTSTTKLGMTVVI